MSDWSAEVALDVQVEKDKQRMIARTKRREQFHKMGRGWFFIAACCIFLSNFGIVFWGHPNIFNYTAIVLAALWALVTLGQLNEEKRIRVTETPEEEKKVVTEADLPYPLDDPDVLAAINEINELCESEFAVPLTVERWREDLKPKLLVHSDSVWVPESMTWETIRGNSGAGGSGGSGFCSENSGGGGGGISSISLAPSSVFPFNKEFTDYATSRGFMLNSWSREDKYSDTSVIKFDFYNTTSHEHLLTEYPFSKDLLDTEGPKEMFRRIEQSLRARIDNWVNRTTPLLCPPFGYIPLYSTKPLDDYRYSTELVRNPDGTFRKIPLNSHGDPSPECPPFEIPNFYPPL